MRAAILLGALALAACGRGTEDLSPATPVPPATIAAPAELVGTHEVAGVGGVDWTSLPQPLSVSITQDGISVPGVCVTAGWTYRFDGETLVTQPAEGPTCRRMPTPEERSLIDAFTRADRVSRMPHDGIQFSGPGGTVTLFSQ